MIVLPPRRRQPAPPKITNDNDGAADLVSLADSKTDDVIEIRDGKLVRFPHSDV